MIYEDKILDYLDGALGDKESAELMHQLSVSPERRVILEQHLQLKNAISDARKPVPVPAAIEARLAERLPVIANYNRELAGASLISTTTARSPFFGRVAAGVAVLLLLGTAVYFGVIRNGTSDESATSTVSNSNSNTTSSSTNVASTTQNSSTDVSSSSVNSSAPTTTSTTATNIPIRTSGGNASRHRAVLSSNDLPQAGGPVVDLEEKNEKLIQQEIPAAETPQLPTISALNDLRTEPIAALSVGERNGTFAMRAAIDEPSEIPLVLRFDYNLGEGYNQVRESDASYTTRRVLGPSGGIDYVLSPHVALGIEGSSTEIARVQETATVANDEELGIKRVVISHSIQSHSEFNTRAMFRYSLNPYDRYRIETSIGGGLAFGENISPLVSFGVTFNSRFSEVISLSAGPMFTGTFARSGPSAAIDVDGPIAYVYTDKAASSTLFTPNVQFKIGLRVTPW